MTLPAVRVCGLGKAYALRRRRVKAGLSLEAAGGLRRLAGEVVGGSRPPAENADVLWALRDVDFAVQPGEMLGIIGRNGAGKSTLLKVLAQVAAPSVGTVELRGRVVSILELGLGFDERMTIRENLRVHARLSGMSRTESSRAEGRIVDFAGLSGLEDEVLGDCPGGSFIRLAFSALVNMDADIVLADEVLAVGDSAFRSECEERLQRGRADGECVLFVSHDMRAVRRLCDRVIWIDRGRIRAEGDAETVVAAYEAELLGWTDAATDASGDCTVTGVQLLAADGAPVGAMEARDPCSPSCVVRVDRPGLRVGAAVELRRGAAVALTATQPWPAPILAPGLHRIGVEVPGDVLNEGRYTAHFRLLVQDSAEQDEPRRIDAEEILPFEVYDTDAARSVWAGWSWGRRCALAPRLDWVVHEPNFSDE